VQDRQIIDQDPTTRSRMIFLIASLKGAFEGGPLGGGLGFGQRAGIDSGAGGVEAVVLGDSVGFIGVTTKRPLAVAVMPVVASI
jgi:hypothetical protein